MIASESCAYPLALVESSSGYAYVSLLSAMQGSRR